MTDYKTLAESALAFEKQWLDAVGSPAPLVTEAADFARALLACVAERDAAVRRAETAEEALIDIRGIVDGAGRGPHSLLEIRQILLVAFDALAAVSSINPAEEGR